MDPKSLAKGTHQSTACKRRPHRMASSESTPQPAEPPSTLGQHQHPPHDNTPQRRNSAKPQDQNALGLSEQQEPPLCETQDPLLNKTEQPKVWMFEQASPIGQFLVPPPRDPTSPSADPSQGQPVRLNTLPGGPSLSFLPLSSLYDEGVAADCDLFERTAQFPAYTDPDPHLVAPHSPRLRSVPLEPEEELADESWAVDGAGTSRSS